MISKADIDKWIKFTKVVEPCSSGTLAQIKRIEQNPINSEEMIIVHVFKLGIFVRFDSQEEFEESAKIIEVEFCEHCGNLKGEKQ